MSTTPEFDDRPVFDYSDLSFEGNKDELERLIRLAVARYDTFLDHELFPVQGEFADILDTFEGWKLRFEPDHVEQLMETFRGFPCMNAPPEGVMEQISRREGYYPKFLSVVADTTSCGMMADRNNLSHLDEVFRFVDENGQERMLAYDAMPYEDDFNNYEVLRKYRALGCAVNSVNHLRKCIVIPKTNLFREEGESFWSRPYFGKFDVVAYARTTL
ncbi:hypothetical protein M3A49_40890 [Paraburkholderia sp. CNPSo 3076]|uniref:hypothetical protein n=1 Tax=Paraburkholderia sp. CNPSo 3076 TaxID=2940936 RepID=UPI00224F82CD|nr:hypothetical protein [Paraburkholderia sp. CNPSo 3076]MCX5545701.1 hypothetical protein [Paraburkholderia sp. CNPSo 3076]